MFLCQHGDGEISTTNQKKSEDPKIIRGGGQTRKSKRLKSDTDQASVKTIFSVMYL